MFPPPPSPPSPPCSEEANCLCCPLPHKTGRKTCQCYKMEEEILAIQAKVRVPRNQAIAICDREHPNIRSLNFAATAASSTSQSPSSETPQPFFVPASTSKTQPQKSSKTTTRTQSTLKLANIPTQITTNRIDSLVDYDDDEEQTQRNPSTSQSVTNDEPKRRL